MESFVFFLNFFISLISLYYWQIAYNDFDDFNTFVMIRFQVKFAHSYRLIFISISLTFILSFFTMVLKLPYIQRLLPTSYKNTANKLIKYTVLSSLVFNIIFLIAIYALWPDEWKLLYKSFHFYYIYHHFIICTFILLIWVRWIDMERHYLLGILLLTMAIFIGLVVSAIIMIPPCVLRHYNLLPPKPKVVGHRGAQYISPENTMVSYQIALNKCHIENSISSQKGSEGGGLGGGGGIALETDVQISYDGVPFLLHDSYLFRTTDVRNKDPRKSFQEAYTFNYSSYLAKLDAGSWFTQEDPFNDIRNLPEGVDATSFPEQTLPRFADFLKMASNNGVHVIFDLKFPTECEVSVTDNYTYGRDWNALYALCCPNTSADPDPKWRPPYVQLPFGPSQPISAPHTTDDKEVTCPKVEKVVCKCRHPYGPHLTDLILQAIDRSGIPQHLIWWILETKLAGSEKNPFIEKHPNFVYVFPDPVPVENLTRLGVAKLNLGNHESKPSDIKMYRSNNFTVNVYSVNKPWLFSYYWCLGVDSLTTGKCHLFTHPTIKPSMIMSASLYHSLVTFMNLATLFLLLFVCWIKMRRIRAKSRFYNANGRHKQKV